MFIGKLKRKKARIYVKQKRNTTTTRITTIAKTIRTEGNAVPVAHVKCE